MIVIRHTPHPGCTYRPGDTELPGDTRADCAIARVILERERLAARGSAGSIGMGSFNLLIEQGDDLIPLTPEIEDGLPDGEIDPSMVAELSEPIWDGNNWTSPDVQEISDIAECDSSAGCWDVGDYLEHYDYDPARDGDFEAAAKKIREEAAAEGVAIDGDIEKYLRLMLPK